MIINNVKNEPRHVRSIKKPEACKLSRFKKNSSTEYKICTFVDNTYFRKVQVVVVLDPTHDAHRANIHPFF